MKQKQCVSGFTTVKLYKKELGFCLDPALHSFLPCPLVRTTSTECSGTAASCWIGFLLNVLSVRSSCTFGSSSTRAGGDDDDDGGDADAATASEASSPLTTSLPLLLKTVSGRGVGLDDLDLKVNYGMEV